MPAKPSAATSRAARTGARKPASPRWTRIFLAALADTSNVAAAARKAKVSTSVVYERRRHDG